MDKDRRCCVPRCRNEAAEYHVGTEGRRKGYCDTHIPIGWQEPKQPQLGKGAVIL